MTKIYIGLTEVRIHEHAKVQIILSSACKNLNVARFTKWKLNKKLGKYTDLDKNLLHSEENQDISITNCMLFLPCVIWKKSQKNLRKDRLQTYGHWPKLCLHLVGTKKSSISAHLQLKFSSLTDWIHVILWVTWSFFFYLFLLTTLQCLNKLSISLHCKHCEKQSLIIDIKNIQNMSYVIK